MKNRAFFRDLFLKGIQFAKQTRLNTKAIFDLIKSFINRFEESPPISHKTGIPGFTVPEGKCDSFKENEKRPSEKKVPSVVDKQPKEIFENQIWKQEDKVFQIKSMDEDRVVLQPIGQGRKRRILKCTLLERYEFVS